MSNTCNAEATDAAGMFTALSDMYCIQFGLQHVQVLVLFKLILSHTKRAKELTTEAALVYITM